MYGPESTCSSSAYLQFQCQVVKDGTQVVKDGTQVVKDGTLCFSKCNKQDYLSRCLRIHSYVVPVIKDGTLVFRSVIKKITSLSLSASMYLQFNTYVFIFILLYIALPNHTEIYMCRFMGHISLSQVVWLKMLWPTWQAQCPADRRRVIQHALWPSIICIKLSLCHTYMCHTYIMYFDDKFK